MWWWAAARSGWWCPQTNSWPPQTWWSRRWRSQWCSSTPWLLVAASQGATDQVFLSLREKCNSFLISTGAFWEVWRKYVWRSPLKRWRSSLHWFWTYGYFLTSPLLHPVVWPVFICFIAYLMVKPHCLSPLLRCFTGLWHKLDLPFLYSNEQQEKCLLCPSLILSFSFTTNPHLPCLFSPSISVLKHTKTHTQTQSHTSIWSRHISDFLVVGFWHFSDAFI